MNDLIYTAHFIKYGKTVGESGISRTAGTLESARDVLSTIEYEVRADIERCCLKPDQYVSLIYEERCDTYGMRIVTKVYEKQWVYGIQNHRENALQKDSTGR